MIVPYISTTPATVNPSWALALRYLHQQMANINAAAPITPSKMLTFLQQIRSESRRPQPSLCGKSRGKILKSTDSFLGIP